MTHNNTSNTELEPWLDEVLANLWYDSGIGRNQQKFKTIKESTAYDDNIIDTAKQALLAKFEEQERLARERWHKEWIELLTWATKQENVTFVDLARKMNSKLLQTKLTTDTSQLSTNKESEKEA